MVFSLHHKAVYSLMCPSGLVCAFTQLINVFFYMKVSVQHKPMDTSELQTFNSFYFSNAISMKGNSFQRAPSKLGGVPEVRP